MDDLDSKQRQALLQLRELTDGADDEVSISMLSIVDWDVQRAAELIFEGGSPSGNSSGFGSGRRNASRPGSNSAAATVASSSSSTSTSSQMDTFEIDDTQQGVYEGSMPTYPPSRARVQNTHFLYTLARPILSVLAFPLHILSNLFRFIFSILRIPLPRLPFASSWLNFYPPLSSRRPGGGGGRGGGGARGVAGPERWLRELEEETGAISMGRLKAIRGTSSAVGIGGTSLDSRGGANAGASTSGAKSANGKATIEFEDGRKYLPDFAICTYEDLLKTCQREMTVGCVVLVSEEHDDVPEFKRSTLTDPGFVKTLYENDIVVWGGDVRDREAWSAAEKLQATTYPFVAFVALQPRRNPGFSSPSSSRSNAPPTLTVLSRHQGPSYTPPSSSSSTSTTLPAPTSAQALVSHLERQLLPRVTPYLNRLLSAQRQRERDRQLREEQDRAFEDAKRRDKEKIERKMKEEREMIEQRRREEEQKRKEEARKRKEAEDGKKRVELRVIWRRWTRRCVVGKSEPHAAGGGGGGGVRIAIRLPSGTRVIQPFSASNATLTSLYAFVDAQLIPKDMSPVDDPISVEGQIGEGEEALEAHILSCCSTTEQSHNKHAYNTVEDYWGFRIATAYPRVEIPWTRDVKLTDVEHLRGGGQVVVEAVQNGSSYGQQERGSGSRSRNVRSGGGKESDGYDTEDSE